MLKNLRHGNGTMKFANGNVYAGVWFNDQFEGHGEYTWADGRIYTGEFKKDKIEGKGMARWPDGRNYEGEWIADCANGHGILTFEDTRVFEGIFNNDFPVAGQMIEPSGIAFLSKFDGATLASDWRPLQKSRIGIFQEGWSTAQPPYSIREFAWDSGARFAGCCIGYRPSIGIYLEDGGDLSYAVFDGMKTFAEGPNVLVRRKLNWPVKLKCGILLFLLISKSMIEVNLNLNLSRYICRWTKYRFQVRGAREMVIRSTAEKEQNAACSIFASHLLPPKRGLTVSRLCAALAA